MKGILAVFWLILVPVAVGRLPFVKRRQPLLAERFVSGYLILFSIMELLTLPMTFLKTPLHVLVISYGIIALLLAAGGIFATVKQRDKIRIKDIFGTENIYLWAVMLLILAQIAMCVFLAHMDADDAFYVAQATTDVQTDTIFEVIPYTGLKYYGLPSRYVLSPFPVFLAVVSQLSMGLHPAIMAHMIFPAVFLLAVYCVQYLLGKKWFADDRRGQGMYLFLVACIASFSAYSVYNAGSFQMVRLWQGKAVLASVFLPLLSDQSDKESCPVQVSEPHLPVPMQLHREKVYHIQVCSGFYAGNCFCIVYRFRVHGFQESGPECFQLLPQKIPETRSVPFHLLR